MLHFKPIFSPSSFTLIKKLFNSSWFSAIRVVSSAYLRFLIFFQSWFQLLIHPAQYFAWCTLLRLVQSLCCVWLFATPWTAHAWWQYSALMYSIPSLEPNCSMSGSNCYFLTCIQVSLEAGKVIWYSHLFKNFPCTGYICIWICRWPVSSRGNGWNCGNQ